MTDAEMWKKRVRRALADLSRETKLAGRRSSSGSESRYMRNQYAAEMYFLRREKISERYPELAKSINGEGNVVKGLIIPILFVGVLLLLSMGPIISVFLLAYELGNALPFIEDPIAPRNQSLYMLAIGGCAFFILLSLFARLRRRPNTVQREKAQYKMFVADLDAIKKQGD